MGERRIRRIAGIVWRTGLLMGSAVAAQAFAASVLTAPLDWQAASIESGLQRLKDQFLDESVAQDTEFVGAVMRNRDGSYEFTQGRGRPGQDRVTFRIRQSRDTEIVALWHTHGAEGPTRAIFSPTDVELVQATGLPFYLITPEGEIRVLYPEHVRSTPGRRPVIGSMGRLPRGSHAGERVAARPHAPQSPGACTDVMEV